MGIHSSNIGKFGFWERKQAMSDLDFDLRADRYRGFQEQIVCLIYAAFQRVFRWYNAEERRTFLDDCEDLFDRVAWFSTNGFSEVSLSCLLTIRAVFTLKRGTITRFIVRSGHLVTDIMYASLANA